MKFDLKYLLYLLPIAFLVVAYKFSVDSWTGKQTARIYEQGRVVADTVKPVRKPVLIDERILNPDNVIASLKVVTDEEQGLVGVQFGNYLTDYGQSLCSAYNKVEIILFGDGISVSGKPPRMILEGSCPNSNKSGSEKLNLNIVDVFPIFLSSDCQSNKKAMDRFSYNNGTQVTITNVDFTLSEPTWLIEKLSFIDESNPVNSFEFNHARIKEILKSKSKRPTDFIEIPCL